MQTPDGRSVESGTERQGASASLPDSKPWWPWAVALALLVVNLLWTGGLALSHDKALNDRLNYHLTARTLAQGGGLAVPAKSDLRVPDVTAPYAVGERPLYPFLASLAIRLAGPSVQATNLVSALMRSLALLPIFALALRLFGRWTAIGTAVIYTLSPPWTGLGSVSMTGTTFALFYYLALLLAVIYCQRPGRILALLTGLCLALTVMSREEGLILGLGLAAIFVLQGELGPSPERGRSGEASGSPGLWDGIQDLLRQVRWADLALFLVGPALGWIGQKLYLWQTFGSLSASAHPLFFNSQYEFLFALRLQTRAEYLASIGGVGGAIVVRLFNHISQLRTLFADGLFVDTGQAGLFPITFLLPLGISIWVLVRDAWKGIGWSRLTVVVLITIILQALAFPSFLGRWRFSEIRHLQVITPFLMMLAADGLVRLWDKALWRRVLVILLCLNFLLFALLNHTLLIDDLALAPSYDNAEIRALRQAAPEMKAGAVILSRKPNRAAYYTDQSAVMMPLAGFKDMMVYAQEHGVTHLVVTPRELETRPGLAEGLATMSLSIPLLVNGGRIQVYEIPDYGFLTAIDEGSALDQEIDMAVPAPPPDWGALLSRISPSTASQAWQTWQRWLEEGP